MNEFKITLKQQLRLLANAFIVPFLLTIFVLYFNLITFFIIIPFLVFFIIDTLPTILLHINYFRENKNCILIIDKEKGVLSFNKKGKDTINKISDISCLCTIKSTVYNSGKHSFGQYRFCKIVFVDSTEITVTCLMVYDIENTLKYLLDVQPINRSKLFCFVD
ncbi:hypothetical protein [Parasediminibacterium paludis]